MEQPTTTWAFKISPSETGAGTTVRMESNIPNEQRQVDDEFASILLSIGHLADSADPLRGIMYLIGSSMQEYAAVEHVGGDTPVSGTGLSPLRYLLINWAEIANEQGQAGEPTGLEVTATNASAVDSITPLVQAIRQQLYKLETAEERDLVRHKLQALFDGQ